MDFKITSTDGLGGDMAWDKAEDLLTHVILSLAVRYGDFFQLPEFGSKLYTITKITDKSLNLAKQYIEEALQWLLDTSKAESITVLVERDIVDRSRMNIRVQVEERDGNQITYDTYHTLV